MNIFLSYIHHDTESRDWYPEYWVRGGCLVFFSFAAALFSWINQASQFHHQHDLWKDLFPPTE